MRAPPSWRQRLSGALVALAMPAAVAALLVFSLTMVRREAPPPETFFFLPPAPKPVTIDARQAPKSALARPSAPGAPPLPPYASSSVSGFGTATGSARDTALLQALG